MGNVIGSLLSGFAQAVEKLFGSPLEFLTGKSCSSVCGSTWDLICYMENFCVANLLKLAMAAVLLYIVLLFFYLSYKLGVCECIGRTLCKMVWACFATCFSIWEYGCYFFCYKLPLMKRKRRRRQKDIEESDIWSTSGGGGSSSYRVPLKHIEQRRPLPRQWTDYKGDRLRRSLRPRSHRTRVAITGDLRHRHHHHHRHRHGHASMVNDITVTRTSMFAQKGSNSKGVKMHRRQRR